MNVAEITSALRRNNIRKEGTQLKPPLEPVIRRLLGDWEDIKAPRVTEILRDDYGYRGSVDLVRKRLAQMRPRVERPAQRTGHRPGQVAQFDWRRCRPGRRSPAASSWRRTRISTSLRSRDRPSNTTSSNIRRSDK
jgi:hypothetical protein